MSDPVSDYRTQRVTAVDIRNGRIRVPSTETADTKNILPSQKDTIKVVLRGEHLECRWDPRMGPDKQRSGVIYIGSVLAQLVQAEEVLTVQRSEADEYHLT
jgi:hypothetical protein